MLTFIHLSSSENRNKCNNNNNEQTKHKLIIIQFQFPVCPGTVTNECAELHWCNNYKGNRQATTATHTGRLTDYVADIFRGKEWGKWGREQDIIAGVEVNMKLFSWLGGGSQWETIDQINHPSLDSYWMTTITTNIELIDGFWFTNAASSKNRQFLSLFDPGNDLKAYIIPYN